MKTRIFLGLFLLAAAMAVAQPVVTGLSGTTVSRSDRLLITGSGFNAVQNSGRVEIAGVTALLTRWSDTLIAAYVPESAPTGTVDVQVFTSGGGASNIVPLKVALRPGQDGQIRWRFQADADYILSRPAVSSDGTVYAADISGHLYALSPGGGLKWIFSAPGSGSGSVSVGTDGTIYVGSTTKIFALRPDGTLLWKFDQNPSALFLLGPNVGPDGNIYAVATEGIGVFSMTPQGSLRWSSPESYDRPVVIIQEVVFGQNAFYFHANNHLRGIAFDGSPVFSNPGSLSVEQGDPQPAVGPDGTIYSNTFSALGGGLALGAFDPSGNLLWNALDDFPGPTNILSMPDVGSDGVIYDGQNLFNLYAVNPDGSVRWHADTGLINSNIVSPLNDLILVAGVATYGKPGFLEAVSTAGNSLWRTGLPVENGFNIVPMSRSRFSTDGQTAYIGTAVLGQSQVNPHSYLYSVQTSKSTVALSSLTLNPARVQGGTPSQGMVTLTVVAPAGGALVKLASNNTDVAAVPASLTVPAGAISATFTVKPRPVSQNTALAISASCGGVVKKAKLKVMP